jgi:predicted small integral membrane protein
MIGEAQVVVTPVPPISLFDRIWPVASLTTAAIVDLAWMGLIGYGLFQTG